MSEFSSYPKLRDIRKLYCATPYELSHIPDDVIRNIGRHLIYLLHTGRTDVSGDDWGDIFAKVLNGTHFASPVGIADVAVGKSAWSLKTVKSSNAFGTKSVRLISGRCSPDYSFGISNPHEDIQRTGQAVLAVWNARIDIAYESYNPVRVNVLIRSDDMTKFRIFEEHIERYRTTDYEWKENRNGNLEGYHKVRGTKCFTWQPHGAQFTIHTDVPDDARKFRIRKPPVAPIDEVLKMLKYDESWVDLL